MYDLRVGEAAAPYRVIEVVGAVDQLWTQTWNTGLARPPLKLDLAGDWMVSVELGANFKLIRSDLSALLGELEDHGIDTLSAGSARVADLPLFERLQTLRIDFVSRYKSNGTGKVSFHMMGPGGAVDSEGRTVPEWVSEFLSDPARADVLKKLSAVDAPHQEVFIPVTLEGAPWSVMSYLSGISARDPSLPPAPPVLPHPVSDVWVVATVSFKDALGVRWDGRTWSTFRSRGEGIDDATEPATRDGVGER